MWKVQTIYLQLYELMIIMFLSFEFHFPFIFDILLTSLFDVLAISEYKAKFFLALGDYDYIKFGLLVYFILEICWSIPLMVI